MIESVRWSCQYQLNLGVNRNDINRLYIPTPRDYWTVKLLRISEELIETVQNIGSQIDRLINTHLDPESGYDGYAVNPSEPYRIDPWLLDLVKLVLTTESELDEFQSRLKTLEGRVDFGTGGFYEPIVRQRLGLAWKIIPRFKMYAHANLWLYWISKSLNQIVQFKGLIEEDGYYKEVGEDGFPFLAFPPLLTAAISCTAVLEEVGAEYINAFGGKGVKSVDTDETNCSEILQLLEDVYPDIDRFDLDIIEREVIGSRNDYSHYMMRRATTIEQNTVDDFIEGIGHSFRLIGDLSQSLFLRTIDKGSESNPG